MMKKRKDVYTVDNITDERFDTAAACLGKKFRPYLDSLSYDVKCRATEIRLRVNRPIELILPNKKVYVSFDKTVDDVEKSSLILTKCDLTDIFRCICDYSVYSYSCEIKNGFITVRGGHRAGMCGTAVFEDNSLSYVKDISSVNIRVARQIHGCADRIIELIKNGKGSLLIAGKPLSGKTTVLRDLARQISYIYKTSVIDERGELAGTYVGEAQNDMGLCDIYNGYMKNEGIMHALRSMSPEYIVCDEIGGESDAKSIANASHAGVYMAATAHAADMNDLIFRSDTSQILLSHTFKYIVFIDKMTDFTVYKAKEQSENEDVGLISGDIYRCNDRLFYERQA